MSWGLKNRISNIIKPNTGHTVMLAVDHGYFQGPTTGLRVPKTTIQPLIPFADAIMLTRGILRTSIDTGIETPIVLRVSGGTSILKELSNEGITTSMEEAIRLNVSAVAVSIFIGGEYEKESLLSLSKLVNEGEEYGIPVLAVTAVGKDMVRDARYLGLASRICVEIGAHIIKTYYCDNFNEVVEACGNVPVVIAGGKKIDEKDALLMAKNAVDSGAVGVDMGRNIFQSDNPIGMIKAVRAIVHENSSVEEASGIYKKRWD